MINKPVKMMFWGFDLSSRSGKRSCYEFETYEVTMGSYSQAAILLKIAHLFIFLTLKKKNFTNVRKGPTTMLLHSTYLPWVHTIETTNISRRRWAIQPSPAATDRTPLGSVFKWSQKRQSASTFAPLFKQYKSYRLILWAAKVSQTEDKAVEPSR